MRLECQASLLKQFCSEVLNLQWNLTGFINYSPAIDGLHKTNSLLFALTFLAHIALFDHVFDLLVFCLCVVVFDFFFVLFCFDLFVCLFFSGLCLFSKDREKKKGHELG